jgi:hypothetical protein
MSSAIAVQPVESKSDSRPYILPKRLAEPSLREVLLLAIAASVLFLLAAIRMRSFTALVYGFGDSVAYMNVASAIRHWDFSHLVVKQFWGYPYAMALLSTMMGASDRVALLVVSYLSYLVSVGLAHRLWGGWVAALFAILNFDWLQRAVLGGSEPLFMAFLLAAFLAARQERWTSAALLASLATVVRPLGIFALIGVGLVLLRRRQYGKLLAAVAIGAIVGGLYIWPMATHLGDPLATVHSYQSASGRSLFGVPFYAIILGTVRYPAPLTNLVLSFLWIAFVTAGAVAMACTREFREYAKAFPVEVLFAVPYLLMIYSYNYPAFARSNFARFAIPVIPFVLVALGSWIPRNRYVLGAIAFISPVLAAVSALGLQNVLHGVK